MIRFRSSRLRVPAQLPAALLGALVGLAVVLPWIGGRPLFLLDWAIGPRTPVLPRVAYGLDGGLTQSLPRHVAVVALQALVGSSVTWLLLAVSFPVASVGAARLAAYVGLGRAGQLGGALLYCVNPWVLDRIAVGHLGMVLGYALVPWFALVVARDLGTSWRSAAKAGLLLAVLLGLSIHWFWMAGLFLGLGPVLVRRSRRALAWVAVAVLSAVPASTYLLIGPLAATGTRGLPGAEDLGAYQSAGSGLAQLAGHLVSLQGFWRPLPQEPLYLLPAWPLLCAALLLVVAVGYRHLVLGRSEQGRAARLVGLVGLVGLVLAFGGRGPTGGLFQLLYDHLPGFRVMREPQKFDAVLALAYALGFGAGAERMLAGLSARGRAAGASLLAGLVLATSFSLFWGIGGSIKSSTVPASYAVADRAMDPGAPVLVLPWHLYLGFPFTQGRIIANPAPALFDRPVLSGDVAELPGVPELLTNQRSAAVQRIVSEGPRAEVSDQVAAVGVHYVVLLHGGDWLRYDWLARQTGLERVLSTPELDLYRLKAPPTRCDIRHVRTTTYTATCPPGQLVLPEPFDPGWEVAGSPASATPGGLTAFAVGDQPVTVRYQGAGVARLLLATSAGGFLALWTLLAIGLRPWHGGRRSRSDIVPAGA